MEHTAHFEYPTHWFDEDAYGRIIMRGKDALALLQRLTTNDMLRLGAMQGNQTVLTTPIGRIIDVLHVVNTGDEVWVLTSAGQGPTVYSHLKKNIFFNDAVTLEPAARTYRQIAIYGSAATELVAATLATPLESVPAWHAVRVGDILAVRCTAIGGASWRLLIAADQVIPAQIAALPQLSESTLSDWQIEAAVPAFGAELSQEYIPLEAGLEHAISFSKGCYVGQEIIARMESRGRRAKQLTAVRLSAAVVAPAQIHDAAGQVAGVLTRATVSERAGGVVGLAYISSKVAADATLSVTDAVVTRRELVAEGAHDG
jgi:aminomethyltransferase